MKVFISYAREDLETAKKLYHDLKRAGISPWMDKQDLLPGQNWQVMISKAIQESKYFLALLSSHSLTKRGFVQKELKMALDILDEFPEDDIFIIPIRIEDCKPEDEKLKYLHWADFFPSYEDGLSQILRVLVPGHLAETAGQPSVYKLKYQLRKTPITVLTKDVESNFKLDKRWRPLEYIKNEFKDNGDGTITDHITGLMWQKTGSDYYMPYEEGHIYIQEMNRNKFADYEEWRLPTIEEMSSLIKLEKQTNDLYINPIFEEKQRWCWTSDKHDLGGVWLVNFSHGYFDWNSFNYTSYVRAVRSVE